MVVSSESSEKRRGGCLIVEEVLEEEIVGTTTVLETGAKEVKTLEGTRGVSKNVIIKKRKLKRPISGRTLGKMMQVATIIEKTQKSTDITEGECVDTTGPSGFEEK